jgi:hypothetical protein
MNGRGRGAIAGRVFGFLALSAFPSACFAQTAALSLGGGSASPGSTVILNLSVNSTGSQPASVEWTLNYSTGDFSTVTFAAGAAATSAGKSISCNSTAGNRKCVAWGVNSNTISNGVVATVSMKISASTKNTSSAVTLASGLSALTSSAPVATSTTGAIVTIVQSTGFGISGTISPSSMGSGTTVTLSGAASATTTADGSGNYSFGGLANGNYQVTPTKSGYSFTASSQSINISGSSISGVNFSAQAVSASYSISGTISPAASGSGASVALSGASSATTMADGSGNYSFTGLANGSYTVTPTKSDFTFTPASQPATISGANVSAINFNANSSSSNATLSVNYNSLNFGYNGTLITSPQTVTVNISPASAAWTATSNQTNISVNPPSGVGSGALQITVAPGPSGTVTVTAAGASGSPQQIQVNVNSVTPGLPTGSFDTPVNDTRGVAGNIAVTGWALDNIEITSVGIWRAPVAGETPTANGLVWIGNATLVPGARPDVQGTYPNAPWSYRAGWGYMLLTNFLPNPGGPLGNGTYQLHAIAVNKAGYQTDLGIRVITVDNVDATQPFGTIDTPDQGGSASGSAFVNFGWALTQNPYVIPLDGSTITVIVDGVTLGHPTYNQYRSDIATLFPGLANSNGAVGYYTFDTTQLSNGIHTIAWVVADNAGRQNGIGSRYFSVLNSGIGTAAPADSSADSPADEAKPIPQVNRQAAPLNVASDGTSRLDAEELSLIELPLEATSGYLLVGGQRTALPIGSTLHNGTFYWQLGPGFLGDYLMTFERADGTEVHIRIRVHPKTNIATSSAQ